MTVGDIGSRFTRLRDAAEDLLFRIDCVGCGRVIGEHMRPIEPVSGSTAQMVLSAGGSVARSLCVECGRKLQSPPARHSVGDGALPLWSAGAYGGPHRAVILAAKDHVRGDAIDIMGRIHASMVVWLASAGNLPDPRLAKVHLIPAPTKRSSARARGGDIVTRSATVAAHIFPGLKVHPCAWLEEAAADSVALNRLQRGQNIGAHLRLDSERVGDLRRASRRGEAIVLVDDVCTTGATLNQLCLGLVARGVRPSAALTMSRA